MATEQGYFVDILASRIGGTLYIGMTNDLMRRLSEHHSGTASRFTARYHVGKLVYFEQFHDVRDAQQRERRLKKWKRSWKIRLIQERNPN